MVSFLLLNKLTGVTINGTNSFCMVREINLNFYIEWEVYSLTTMNNEVVL